ncbi:transmembrane protein, partial [Toxoplasma gondii TgCatPRC2]
MALPRSTQTPRGSTACRLAFFVAFFWASFAGVPTLTGDRNASVLPQPLGASAAYFYVQESQDKCFVESVPVGVALTVTYKNPENPGVTCSIIFKDPSGRSVYSKEVLPTEPQGKISHMTATAGEYKVCISCASSKWFNTQLLKWSISIELGDTEINLDELAKKDQVDSLQLKLQAIAKRLEAMQAENEYERVQVRKLIEIFLCCVAE